MRAVYGAARPPRLIALLRNPIDRLETSYWAHPHYARRFGDSPAGLHAYAQEMISGFSACERVHGTRRCAFLFEMLSPEYGEVFFHADQVRACMRSPIDLP